jgi:hypothetical protein
MAAPWPGGRRDPTPQERDERISLHAMNTPHSVIAARFGITIGGESGFRF